jgi:hypothetical protein
MQDAVLLLRGAANVALSAMLVLDQARLQKTKAAFAIACA